MIRAMIFSALCVATLLMPPCASMAANAQTAPDAATRAPLPQAPGLGALSRARGADAVLSALAGIPYRDDGCVDEKGNFTRFARPEQQLGTAGFNCSGLTLQASRFLFAKNYTLAEVTRDRRGDSGPGAALGQDWDFGWDLILNISEGMPRRMLLPGGKSIDPATADALTQRGFDLHAPETWRELPGRIKPGHIYLVSFSKDVSQPGYTVMHYHVGIMHRDAAGRLILTDTTSQAGKSVQRNLTSPDSLNKFLKAFANSKNSRKFVALIEIRSYMSGS